MVCITYPKIKTRRFQQSPMAFLTLLAFLCLLAQGCGQTGPLHLPESGLPKPDLPKPSVSESGLSEPNWPEADKQEETRQ